MQHVFPTLARLALALLLSFSAHAYDLTVAKDGSGDFRTVQAAINAAPTGRTTAFTIFIRNGKYREKLTIPSSKPFLQLIGESVANTYLTWNDANTPSFPGNSASVIIQAADFSALNLTFENSYGDAPQGLAVYFTADRIAFKNCRFLGGQDTMQLNNNGQRSFFKDCYIDGVVDFIFGSGRGLFENCVIYPRTRRDGGSGGYITAANTQAGQAYGFVFRNCIIPENRGTTTYTLGRPWQNDSGSTPTDRSHTKVVWLNTTMGNSIKPVGWQLWNAGTDPSVIQYAEYKSRDFAGNLVNVSQRIAWSIQLADADTALYTRAAVLGTWNPCTIHPAFCPTTAPDIAVSNFRAVKGSGTVPSALTWNISWAIAGVQYELLRASTRRGTYAPIYTTTAPAGPGINFGSTDPIPAPNTSYYYYVRASKPGMAAHLTDTLQISSIPTISTTGTVQPFLQGVGLPSGAQNILVAGDNLTTPIIITPPAGFEVSANGGGSWAGPAAPLALPVGAGGTVASTTISIRLNASAASVYGGPLTLTSTAAASVSIALNGTVQAAPLPRSVSLLWWPMASTNLDSAAVRRAGVQASIPTLHKLFESSGSAAAGVPPYSRRYGQAIAPGADGAWTTAAGGNGGNLNRTFYEQFEVAPSGSTALRVDSLLLTTYVTSSVSNTKLAVVWSKSGFTTADSTNVSGGRGPGGVLFGFANGGFATPIVLGALATYRLAFAGAPGVLLLPGERLTYRLYYSCGSTTLTGRFASLRNVVVKGEAGIITGTRRGQAAALSVYPNPSSGSVAVAHPSAPAGALLTVYDFSGRRVARLTPAPGTSQTTVDLTGFAKGNYLLEYTSNGQRWTAQVVRQ